MTKSATHASMTCLISYTKTLDRRKEIWNLTRNNVLLLMPNNRIMFHRKLMMRLMMKRYVDHSSTIRPCEVQNDQPNFTSSSKCKRTQLTSKWKKNQCLLIKRQGRTFVKTSHSVCSWGCKRYLKKILMMTQVEKWKTKVNSPLIILIWNKWRREVWLWQPKLKAVCFVTRMKKFPKITAKSSGTFSLVWKMIKIQSLEEALSSVPSNQLNSSAMKKTFWFQKASS